MYLCLHKYTNELKSLAYTYIIYCDVDLQVLN